MGSPRPEGAERWAGEEVRIRGAYGRRTDHSRYSWFNRAHLLAMQEVEEAMLAALARHGRARLDDVDLLDVGCGKGGWLREFVKFGAQPHRLHGVDLLPDRIDEARRLCPMGTVLRCASATTLEFETARFDIVLQSMLFTSVLDPTMRQRIAAEMLRVVKPDGLIIWYDYYVSNPQNADVRAVSKRELRRLFPGCAIDLQRITLAPPLARRIAPRSRAVWSMLRAIPWLRTHYLAVIHHASRATKP
jgi:SAM-dependent methyltransferase